MSTQNIDTSPESQSVAGILDELARETDKVMNAQTVEKREHTPTPWRYEAGTKTIRAVPSNYWLATMDSWDGAVDNEANAAFICRAVNSYDTLVAALRDAEQLISVARRYFPGSIRNSDKFNLENTCAAIGSALHKAT